MTWTNYGTWKFLHDQKHNRRLGVWSFDQLPRDINNYIGEMSSHAQHALRDQIINESSLDDFRNTTEYELARWMAEQHLQETPDVSEESLSYRAIFRDGEFGIEMSPGYFTEGSRVITVIDGSYDRVLGLPGLPGRPDRVILSGPWEGDDILETVPPEIAAELTGWWGMPYSALPEPVKALAQGVLETGLPLLHDTFTQNN